jgi:hypothetical protein
MLGQPSDIEVIECAIRAVHKAADYDGVMTGMQEQTIRRLKEWKQECLQTTGKNTGTSGRTYRVKKRK